MTSSRDISGLGSSNGLVVCSTGKQSQKQECERFLFCAREKSVSEEHLGVAKDSRKTGKTSFVCCAFLLTCPIYLKSMVDPKSREPSLKERRGLYFFTHLLNAFSSSLLTCSEISRMGESNEAAEMVRNGFTGWLSLL